MCTKHTTAFGQMRTLMFLTNFFGRTKKDEEEIIIPFNGRSNDSNYVGRLRRFRQR